ncbi:tetratricopeptide repeat protein [Kribbella lupini]|uniref:HTH cro/C1-type domain-containing protein n=1 Tax=Kribbella lupini TaxID=291602 RepID=A0ABN2BVD2_9ACTN
MAGLAELLKGFRSAAGLTQEQLAERSGLSVRAIATLETGRRRHPWASTIDRLTTALELSAEQRQTLVDAARRGPASPRDGRPVDLTDFVGREQVTAGLVDLLTSRRETAAAPISISGMGGIGKTALAVRIAGQVAESYPDGSLYLNLGGHGGSPPLSPVQALGHLLRRLGAQHVPDDLQTATARFRSLIADRRLVLLLDDAAEVAQVEPLLPGTGGSAVLITSRPRLVDLAGARQVALDLLAEEEGLRLLAAVLDRRIDQEPEAAAEIVRLCGRLPLALRIAGSHLADRPQQRLAELATALSDERAKLQVLTDEDTGVRATIALSVQSLAAGERAVQRAAARALPLVSQLEGDEFSLRIAKAALDVSLDQAEDALEHLVDANLLETPAVHVYRLHDLVRAVGRELSGPAAEEEVRLRALQEYSALLWRGDELGSEPSALAEGWREASWSQAAVDLDQDQADDIVDAEREALLRTVRSAARGSAAARELVVRLAPALNLFAMNRKRWIEWRDVNQAAAELVDERADPVAAAMITFDLGLAHNEFGDFAAGAAELERTRRLAKELGDRALEHRCMLNLAHAREQAGELAAAYELTLECLEPAVQNQDPVQESWVRLLLGIIAGKQGRQDEQQAALERAVELYSGPAIPRTRLGMRQLVVGESYREAGRFELASAALEQALEHYRSEERWNGVAEVLDHLGAVSFGLGRWDDALVRHEQALALAEEHSLWDREANIRVRRGHTYRAIGRTDEARRDWREALRLYAAHGSGAADDVRELLEGLPAA